MIQGSHVYVVVLPVTIFVDWLPCDKLWRMEKFKCLTMCKGWNNVSAANDNGRVQKTKSTASGTIGIQKFNTMQPLRFPSTVK